VPATHRHLLTTLHVLFPALVLPALDLLDRGLVARVVLAAAADLEKEKKKKQQQDQRQQCERQLQGERQHANDDDAAAADDNRRRDCAAFYLVGSTSAAAAAGKQPGARERRRRWDGTGDGDGHGGAGRAPAAGYVVRLGAWSCSCAAFAFAAVRGEEGSAAVKWEREGDEGGLRTAAPGMEEGADAGWSFGGLSLDGWAAGEGVPVCKHLLACVLAERWSAALGRYVVERRVGKEEMAGIVADI
jgi:hypothetical protein